MWRVRKIMNLFYEYSFEIYIDETGHHMKNIRLKTSISTGIYDTVT